MESEAGFTHSSLCLERDGPSDFGLIVFHLSPPKKEASLTSTSFFQGSLGLIAFLWSLRPD